MWLWAAWSRRWTSDDGFINLRVVQQLLAGNGPVFNAGERIEIATSTLWVFVLAVASRVFFWASLEWVALGVSLACAAGAGVLAFLGARSLWGSDRVVWPAGLAAFVALPPVWDFTTSGLEVSFGLLWLAACFWGLCCMERRFVWLAVLIGLGPLVRPDFAVFSAVFLGALLVVARGSLRRLVLLVAAAALLPGVYQLFRMAYYGALVPNTAFAKEASRANWTRGWFYLRDFVGPYWLWIALVLLAVLAVLAIGRGRPEGRIVVLACIAGGVVHWLYVTRVGGDFMHGRLLLPGLFAFVLPAAAVPVARWQAGVGVALLAWAVVLAAPGRTPYKGFGERYGMADERAVYATFAGHPHPVVVEDYRTFWVRYARIVAAATRQDGPRLWLEEEAFEVKPDARRRLPLRPGLRAPVVAFRNVGMLGFASDTSTRIVDILGLGDPIASRIFVASRARPGHEKFLDLGWVAARFGAPSLAFPDEPRLAASTVAAREALSCGKGPLATILPAVEAPWSLSRAVRNVRVALSTYTARIPADPVLYRDTYCR